MDLIKRIGLAPGTIKRLVAQPSPRDEFAYFRDAVWAYLVIGEENARQAALILGQRATGELRRDLRAWVNLPEDMRGGVLFLDRALDSAYSQKEIKGLPQRKVAYERASELHSELSAGWWTPEQMWDARFELGHRNPKILNSLENPRERYFRIHYPEIFANIEIRG